MSRPRRRAARGSLADPSGIDDGKTISLISLLTYCKHRTATFRSISLKNEEWLTSCTRADIPQANTHAHASLDTDSFQPLNGERLSRLLRLRVYDLAGRYASRVRGLSCLYASGSATTNEGTLCDHEGFGRYTVVHITDVFTGKC